jgi:hypothetical protein
MIASTDGPPIVARQGYGGSAGCRTDLIGPEVSNVAPAIVDEVLEEAGTVDTADDLEFWDRRGDELSTRWVDRRAHRARLPEALRQIDAGGPDLTDELRLTTDSQQ